MDPQHHHPQHDHERTDVQTRVLVWMAIGLAIFLCVSLPLMIGVFKIFLCEDKSAPVQSPLAFTEQPPAPNLQAVPSMELQRYRQAQHQWLDEYGWIDKQQKVVRIPIEEATRLLAERGLPKAPPQAATTAGGVPAPVEKTPAAPATEGSP
jgi:hypothetical protein